MRFRALAPALLLTAAAVAAADSVLPPSEIPPPKVEFAPRSYVCRRAAGPLRIDGRLDEPSWQEADWTKAFVDIEGPSRPEPRFRTVVQMLWDDECLYIGAFLEEPHVWATLTKRDSIIFQDNDFEVFVDPDGDTHTYGELEINALNTVWDLLLVRPYRDGGPAVHAWDIPGLRSAVHVNGTLNDPSDVDKSWTVEIALPFAAFREITRGTPERPAPGDQWRVTFSRVEYRVEAGDGGYAKVKDPGTGQPLPEDNWTWTPQGVINVHYPEMWGYVQFSAKAVGKGSDGFRERPDERVKWALRRVYYAERAYALKAGRFSGDWKEIAPRDAGDLKVKGWSFPPALQATDRSFEAAVAQKSGASWRIRQDGLVWKEKPAAK